jgi:hypothetical protein
MAGLEAPSALSSMLDFLGIDSGPEAYGRKERSPISIQPTQQPNWLDRWAGIPMQTDVSGSYEPTTNKIVVNYPDPSQSLEISDVLKHELVHQALRNVDLPENYENIGFTTLGATDEERAEIEKARRRWNQQQRPAKEYPMLASPLSDFNWRLWHRAGDPTKEIPAYMSIYQPEHMGPEGVERVSPRTREQYMSDLYNYLYEHGYTRAGDEIQRLIKGREQAQKIFPGLSR